MVRMSDMQDADSWEDHEQLKTFLGNQLFHGRMALVLGAGASFGFGLDGWSSLVDALFELVGESRPVQQNMGKRGEEEALADEPASELFLSKHCGGNEEKLASSVHQVLYRGFDSSIKTLRANDLLASITSLITASVRGSVSKVITYNFDDILETYLLYHGLQVDSITSMPSWPGSGDVSILHVHGFLPSDKSRVPTKKIVFTQTSFDRVVGNSWDDWFRNIFPILQSHTCLFVGLSGEDQNLMTMLAQVAGRHVSKERNDLFWGVRFGANPSDPIIPRWKTHGVFPCVLNAHEDIPHFLFSVCQEAGRIALGV